MPRVPKTRREALQDFRTDQILAAARRVIGAHGYAEVSIDQIAEAAGVARSTIYAYFGSKQDLLNQCLAQNRVGLGERLQRETLDSGSVEDRLASFLGAVLDYVGEYREFFRAVMAVRGIDPFFQEEAREAPEFDAIRAESEAVLGAILKDAQLQGILAAQSANEAGTVLGCLLYGALMRRAHDSEPRPAEEEARMMARVFLYGISHPA